MSQTQAKTDLELLLEKERLLQQKIKLQQGLPHLHGWPWYPWAREFFESANKLGNFLVAANQISKSSTQIRKCIDWATDTKKWPRLWKHRPRQFWYLYPSKEVATIEFEKKWEPEFMPAGEYKNDPVYGWRVVYKHKFVHAIHFNSGISVYFKTYGQDVQDLQTGSVDAIFCDEELPEELISELEARLFGTDGYFNMVFTATLGQEIWRETMEEKGAKERYRGAFKRQISMMDCLQYEDGSPSPWTMERIQRAIAKCKSPAEVQRRIHGRFVSDTGLKYGGFDRTRNMVAPFPIPHDWLVYSGTDIGSGEEAESEDKKDDRKGHPSAIFFIAVRPDFRYGVVFKGWRGDGVKTTASDVLMQHIKMREDLPSPPVQNYYDYACADFMTIATRMGEAFVPAEKSHEVGEQVMNVLFKNGMLDLFEGDVEIEKLAIELATVKISTPKKKAKDDAADATRYGVTKIPWDFSAITGAKPEGWSEPKAPKSEVELEIERRRAMFEEKEEDSGKTPESEIAEWNQAYDYAGAGEYDDED